MLIAATQQSAAAIAISVASSTAVEAMNRPGATTASAAAGAASATSARHNELSAIAANAKSNDGRNATSAKSRTFSFDTCHSEISGLGVARVEGEGAALRARGVSAVVALRVRGDRAQLVVARARRARGAGRGAGGRRAGPVHRLDGRRRSDADGDRGGALLRCRDEHVACTLSRPAPARVAVRGHVDRGGADVRI